MATRSHVFVLVGPWRLSLVLPSAPWQEPKVRVWPASFSSLLPQIFLSFLAVCEQFCPSRRIESDDQTYGPLWPTEYGVFLRSRCVGQVTSNQICSSRRLGEIVEVARSTFSNGLLYSLVHLEPDHFGLETFRHCPWEGTPKSEWFFMTISKTLNTGLICFSQINKLWGNLGNFDLKWCTKKQMQIKNRCHFYVAMRSSRENSGVQTLRIFDSKDLCFVSKLFSYNM